MGYSITTPIKDESSKKKMLTFLKTNFIHWPKLIGSKSNDKYYRGPIGDDFSYDHGDCRIGFDFNASSFDRDYIFTLCRWMALKVGRIDEFPTRIRPSLSGKYPVIVYDGDEATDPDEGEGPWAVIDLTEDEVDKEYHWMLVDKFGVKSKINQKENAFNMDIEGCDGWLIISEEMKRLDKAWEIFNE